MFWIAEFRHEMKWRRKSMKLVVFQQLVNPDKSLFVYVLFGNFD